ncbi:hypothetical protein ACP2AV_07825 [Aliiroseovarius sp. PTFE2010]|uniref:hypothetical protein n=1 Tax=Aliiroseovarius sp. PTFE2010 TaxID=3417190 RepID=UPI003CFB6709
MPWILAGTSVGVFAILAIAILALDPSRNAELDNPAITTNTTTNTVETDANSGRNEVEAGGFPNVESSTDATMPAADGARATDPEATEAAPTGDEAAAPVVDSELADPGAPGAALADEDLPLPDVD